MAIYGGEYEALAIEARLPHALHGNRHSQIQGMHSFEILKFLSFINHICCNTWSLWKDLCFPSCVGLDKCKYISIASYLTRATTHECSDPSLMITTSWHKVRHSPCSSVLHISCYSDPSHCQTSGFGIALHELNISVSNIFQSQSGMHIQDATPWKRVQPYPILHFDNQ